jgi:hypothetical protein
VSSLRALKVIIVLTEWVYMHKAEAVAALDLPISNMKLPHPDINWLILPNIKERCDLNGTQVKKINCSLLNKHLVPWHLKM